MLSAFDAVWALDGRGALYRIEGGGSRRSISRRAGRTTCGRAPARSGRSTTRSGEVIRVDPETNAVTSRIAVGDGPADMVFDGETRG